MADDEQKDELTPDEEPSAEETPTPDAEAPEAEDEAPAEEEAPAVEEPVAEETPAEEVPAAEDAPAAEEAPAEDAPAAEEAPAADAEQSADSPASEEERRPRGKAPKEEKKPDVIPGEHLEPLRPQEQPATPAGEFDDAASAYNEEDGEEAAEPDEAAAAASSEEEAPGPAPLTPKELAADARYQATGKRKTAVARVILKPGSGTYVINGRTLEAFFPRATLQKAVRQPLETAGYEERMDVVARIHGGGVSAQAGALRHGVARALVEADPNLRGELKRRGFLTRDARAKERKKAGLKKARKRPQFSKR
jgi:small subunit ribosomal protein S9